MRAPDTAGLDYSNGQARTVRGWHWSFFWSSFYSRELLLCGSKYHLTGTSPHVVLTLNCLQIAKLRPYCRTSFASLHVHLLVSCKKHDLSCFEMDQTTCCQHTFRSGMKFTVHWPRGLGMSSNTCLTPPFHMCVAWWKSSGYKQVISQILVTLRHSITMSMSRGPLLGDISPEGLTGARTASSKPETAPGTHVAQCNCPQPPSNKTRRNLVVCIDGTANQFGQNVSIAFSSLPPIFSICHRTPTSLNCTAA